MTRDPVRLVVPVLLLVACPTWADFSGLASTGFSYCHVDAENAAGATCAESDLSIGGNCSAGCVTAGSSSEVAGVLPWEVEGEGDDVEGDAVHGARVSARTEEVAPGVMSFSGECFYLGGTPEPPQAALFRFDGDPSVFEGTSAIRVAELVDLALIDADDVLFTHDCTDDDPLPFDFIVEVPGIPPDELVVFVGAPQYFPGYVITPPDVPATSLAGVLLLTLLLLGVGTIFLRRRG
jgi:hypothetical protein